MIKTCRRWNPTWRSCCMNKARPYFLLYSMKMQHYVLIAEQSILKHKQTGTEKSDYNVFSKITHCGSCPVAKKKKKSPLNPSIQGLGAASHRLGLHLCKLSDHQPPSPKQPTSWTHFSIFFQLSSIATQLLLPSSSCTQTELLYALLLFCLWLSPH